ncbi:MAG TPA: 16S rRNA (guanine(966)-N(2))-methyltransferase RsmD [Thermoanaerobaculia bacterium]|nr:16S rRNA (guanine(966)-N(2))-methyltransferase RsmD [Thermoanaerobaculia bacterium]
MKPGVRITGGAFRGRGLAVPAGARPTEGRVREALFSIWRERLPRARFLDLFAGSGVVGLEAAGRGALSVLAVESDVRSVSAIAANAALLGPDEAEGALFAVRRLALPAGLSRLAEEGAGPFDLVFADPPYGFDAYDHLLAGLAPLLAPEAEAAVEHSSRRDLPPAAGPLLRTSVRRYGETALAFYAARSI